MSAKAGNTSKGDNVSSKIFQVAVIKHPSEKEGDEGVKSKIIVPVSEILASSQDKAILTAARLIPADFQEVLEDVEVVVRPF